MKKQVRCFQDGLLRASQAGMAMMFCCCAGLLADDDTPEIKESTPSHVASSRPKAPMEKSDSTICEENCPQYNEYVLGVRALESMAENFFILWNLIGQSSTIGSTELQNREKKYALSLGKEPISLSEIVQNWSENRFTADALATLLGQSNALDLDLEPAFRSQIYSQVPIVSPACPFGRAGALGQNLCPRCQKGQMEYPKMLFECLFAYSPGGEKVNQILAKEDGIYLQQIKKNWCLDKSMLHQFNAWLAVAPTDIQEGAAGSITALNMYNAAIENDEFEMPAVTESTPAYQAARYWIIAFDPWVKAFPDGYFDTLSDSSIHCPTPQE